MQEEEDQFPLSRMVTISKPSFWIFMLACLLLYVASKVTALDTPDMNVIELHHVLIIGTAFTGLLLNIIIITLSNKTVTRILTVICYLFEAISIVILCFLVFHR